MAVYLVCYNLGNDNEKFLKVDKIVKNCSYGDTWMHYIESTWLIKSKWSADEIGRKLSAVSEDEDSFLVIEVTSNYAGWLPPEAFDFMYNKLYK